MLVYIARRILLTLPIAIGVSLVCFALIHLAPGDPLSAVLPEGASSEVIARVREAYGFDRPLPVQYLIWLKHVLVGDFGTSIITRRPVTAELAPAIANTMAVAAVAVVIGFAAGIVMGCVSGYRIGKPADRLVSTIALSGVAIPHYWLGMVLIVVFGVQFNILPTSGMGDGGIGSLFTTWNGFLHLLLPAVTLSVIPASIIARSVRGAVAEVLKQDHIQTLYAKGLAPTRVFRHVMKNALATLLALMGLQFAQLLGGSILVETVFAWPGTGFLLNTAIFTRDLPLLQGIILALAMMFVVINLFVDVLQTVVDPRIKRI
ncbi:ABC transporter permease [Bosea thiooxidans]|nr:ABC transporter permease [Bosea sp. (in: a-proteobacteria)]